MLLAASRSIAGRLGMPAGAARRGVRGLPPAQRGPGPARGQVEAFTCSSGGGRGGADRRDPAQAHLRDGLAWTEMAVLVRSGRTMIPGLTRALVAAGVPVEVAGDEIPLAAEPAVRPLLLGSAGRRSGCATTREEAQVLLTSPLGGLDSMAVRRLGRALREAERTELAGAALPRPLGRAGRPRVAPSRTARRLPGPDRRSTRPARLAELLRPLRARQSRPAAQRRKRCGCSGPAPTGRSGCAGRPRSAGRRAAGPTGIWTPSARCSTSRPALRRCPAGAGSRVSWPKSRVSRSPRTRCASPSCAGQPSGCSPPTAPRVWSGLVVVAGRAGGQPGRTYAVAVRCWSRTGWAGREVTGSGSHRQPDRRGTSAVLRGLHPGAARLVVTAVAGTEGEGDQPSRFLDRARRAGPGASRDGRAGR